MRHARSCSTSAGAMLIGFALRFFEAIVTCWWAGCLKCTSFGIGSFLTKRCSSSRSFQGELLYCYIHLQNRLLPLGVTNALLSHPPAFFPPVIRFSTPLPFVFKID